ncbi:DUF3149 domain-containing protein [Chitinilyticum litopenaei]|uniref:DUF3149 domain-containing protein n=1 Tax=Chitinilyticum litopenaei TaxID=1121276 RepID=UPI0004264683|nr:DUF3149 domain-containing protein [Chitinilyticum litopenaei]
MENTPLQALFTSDIGLLSLFTIVFILVMAVYIFLFVRRHVREDTAAAAQREQEEAAARKH